MNEIILTSFARMLMWAFFPLVKAGQPCSKVQHRIVNRFRTPSACAATWVCRTGLARAFPALQPACECPVSPEPTGFLSERSPQQSPRQSPCPEVAGEAGWILDHLSGAS